MRILLLALCAASLAAETYQGNLGYWVDTVATAYSPEDAIDHHYRESKGKWRYITADGRTDVRSVPYGVAVPNVDKTPKLAYGTKVIIPYGYGYLDKCRPNDRVFPVADTGYTISQKMRETKVMHIDLRYISKDWSSKWKTTALRMFVITGVAPPEFDYRNDLFYDPNYVSK